MDIATLIPIITAISVAPLSSWLTTLLMRRKYDAEVNQLKAKITSTKTDVRGKELDNVRKAMDILMTEVVEPLKVEINGIRREISNLRTAIKQINNCPHAAVCPVRDKLQEQARSVIPRSRAPTQSYYRRPSGSAPVTNRFD